MRSRRRGRRNETRSRRREIVTRRDDVSRRRGRRVVISRRGRRDVNRRPRIGRVKEGTATKIQRNAEIGGLRRDRNAQRSDRDGADEERSSERASQTAFDGSFHRESPRKVGKRRSSRFGEGVKSTKPATANVANAFLPCMRRLFISTRRRAKKLPFFRNFDENLS